MTQKVEVCIGYAKDVPVKPRFQVADECGPLRIFYTKAEALRWMQPWMRLTELPKCKREKLFIQCEEALL